MSDDLSADQREAIAEALKCGPNQPYVDAVADLFERLLGEARRDERETLAWVLVDADAYRAMLDRYERGAGHSDHERPVSAAMQRAIQSFVAAGENPYKMMPHDEPYATEAWDRLRALGVIEGSEATP